jgi:integrase/recombinase XerC
MTIEHHAVMAPVSRYDEPLSVPRTLPERDQLLLLKVTGERRNGFRDHLLLAIALGTALRAHELLALDVGDVLDSEGVARRRVRLRVFKRSADEPPIQEVVLSERLRRKLEKFVAWKSRRGESVAPDAPLFVSRLRRRLSARQLRRLVHVWQARAGASVDLNCHALRHSAITNLYRATKDLRLAQRFARHKSVRSTTRYTHPTDDDLLRAVETLRC